MRFWLDISGQDRRMHVRERVCPISGPGLLCKNDRKRKAREIIQASGADSAEHFHKVITPKSEVTFREQSEVWLKQLRSRKRKPIRESYAVSIQGALDKWILPAIGDVPLRSVDNLTVKPLIETMSVSGLTPRTVNKYTEHVKQVVASMKNTNGEPVHKRTWNADAMDLPIMRFSEQRRPTLKQDVVSSLIAGGSGQEQALYVLLAATGMRVSEALAIETRHLTNGGRTVIVEQQVEKNHPRIVRYLKTDAAAREVDLHPDVAEYLRRYATGKSGLLFSTESGTPHLYGNLARRCLSPRLATLGLLGEKGMGWHALSVSVRRGSGALVAWKTSITSGWHTSRRRCPRSTRISTRSCSCVSTKQRA